MGIVGKVVENYTILLFAQSCWTNSFQIIAKTKMSFIEYFVIEIISFANFLLLNQFSGQQTLL